MSVKDSANKVTKKVGAKIGAALISNKAIKNRILNKAGKEMRDYLLNKNPQNRPIKIQYEKLYAGEAILNRIGWGIENKLISRKSAEGLLSVFLPEIFTGGSQEKSEFYKKYGRMPPKFVAISPEGKCNLKCTGCYAASESNLGHIPYEVFSSFIDHAKKNWKVKFWVVPGGEPFSYKDNGKTLIDIAEEHDDCFFMPYTNGTLINKKMAESLAKVGNISPSISVEGFEKETDARRGKGVYKKVLRAMENLREFGVPYGISFTATRENADIIIENDEFYKHWFENQMATYGWIFQYMPIGREFTIDMLPTVEQRKNIAKKSISVMRDDKIFFPDFWGSATLSDGCISAGRPGGYLYIDWNGKVGSCVFVPYAFDNIIDVYNQGRNFDTILESEYFKKIRNWQSEYGYEQPAEKTGNWLRPCPIRDHYGTLYDIIMNTPGVRPMDKNAELALKDEDYRKKLIEYGKAVERGTCELWKQYIET